MEQVRLNYYQMMIFEDEINKLQKEKDFLISINNLKN